MSQTMWYWPASVAGMVPPVVAACRKVRTLGKGMGTGPRATPQTMEAASATSSPVTRGWRARRRVWTVVTWSLSG